MGKAFYLNRYASIVYRQGNRFYDRVLAPYLIGSGQQFFLLQVGAHPGIGVLDLAKLCQCDKGTATRAAQKLEEQGYLRSEGDARDKRARCLYTTEAAQPIMDSIRAARDEWHRILTQSMTVEEVDTLSILLTRLADNAFTYMEQEERKNEG